ncbi:MAG: DNA-binding protein [Campylobacteraceae bacterium]|nr:DNA-binding protein [Campylobacteraceae bacterium]
MRVEFRKITEAGLPINIEQDELLLSGNVFKKSSKLFLFEGKLEGFLRHNCDICLSEIKINIDEDVKIWIGDEELPKLDEELPNGIEFFKGYADFKEVIISEIEAIKSDYFYCEKCQNNKGE